MNSPSCLFLVAMAIALSMVNLLEAAYCVMARSTDLLEPDAPITVWVSMPSFVQWENLRKMPFSTWKNHTFVAIQNKAA